MGDVVRMQAGCRHTVLADSELQLIEVQLGKMCIRDRMGVLQHHAKAAAQITFADLAHINAVIGDGAGGDIIKAVMRLVIVVLPAPVEPTKAIFCPGLAYSVTSCRVVWPGM